jgi:hypothetical protein
MTEQTALEIPVRRETVRAADTATVRRLNADCVARNRAHVLDQDLVERLAPDGVHLLWGSFPHDQQTPIARVAGDPRLLALPDRIPFRNGSPDWPSRPHLRTTWLLTVVEGDPKEGIIHLDHPDVVALPVYDRPPDAGYPPAPDAPAGTADATLRVADTATLLALNGSSVSKDHNKVLPPGMAERLDPDGVHLLWATFPHDQRTTITRRSPSGDDALAEEITLRNGSPGSPEIPHLRCAWLLSVRDGDPVEVSIHLDHAEVASLPEYVQAVGAAG